MPQLRKVLVANRSEIAVRIIRAAAEAGIASVAVYSQGDELAPHVALADEAHALAGHTPAQTYLDIGKVLAVAELAGADCVHPGYGFLSERADFAEAVTAAGLVWIGPGPAALRLLGDKVSARSVAAAVGAPLVAGSGPLPDASAAVAFAAEHGLPVAIKAAYGGGGRGMRVARTIEEIPGLWGAAQREAQAAFGRGECYVEQFIDRARHVEAQVLADQHGNVIVAGLRDCSLQRRYQKLVEEAPAPFLGESQRRALADSAKAIFRQAGYVGAGTVEFLVGDGGKMSFLEVNARLQVEHPVTEETAGLDIVREMFRIAAGERLSQVDDIEPRGHSIEFRINAEDPARGFVPCPGRIEEITWPAGPGVRIDAGVRAGQTIDGSFDSMLAKLIVTGPDRRSALERSRRALDELVVTGVQTVVAFHRAVVRHPAFAACDADSFAVHTRWIETEFDASAYLDPAAEPADKFEVLVAVGGRAMRVGMPGLRTVPEIATQVLSRLPEERSNRQGDEVSAPMQGTVARVFVQDGQLVSEGDPLAVVEAMKMENAVHAHKSGVVTGFSIKPGDLVRDNTLICRVIDPAAEEGVT
jgi:acetyl-CoA/propionyl-CoA carboxylase biotin carboxyl carrier protein